MTKKHLGISSQDIRVNKHRMNELANNLKEKYPDSNLLDISKNRGDAESADELIKLTIEEAKLALFQKFISKNNGEKALAISNAIDDIAQDTATSVAQHFDTFREEATFRTWVHKIATNKALNFLRKKRELPLHAENDVIPNSSLMFHSRETAPQQSLEYKETLQKFDAAKQLLSDKQRTVIERRHEGASYEDIAEGLAIPVGTVKSNLFKARNVLAKNMGIEIL